MANRKKILKQSKAKSKKPSGKAKVPAKHAGKSRPPAKKKAVIKKKTAKRVLTLRKTTSRIKEPAAGEGEVREISPEEKEKMRRVGEVLTNSFVRQTLIEIGGENALAIVRNFYGSLSDEELAKGLKLKISDVRATLNRLHNKGLVSYVREKDSETGWYSYSWSLNDDRIRKWVEDITRKNSVYADGGERYFCRSCGAGSVVCFEDASDNGFKCAECSRMLEFMDESNLAEIEELFRRKSI